MAERSMEAPNVTEDKKDFRFLGLPLGALITIIAVVVLLVILGLGLVRTQQGPVGIGSRAPEFTLTTFEDQEIATQDLGGQVIVVNFWASWCKPCEQEAAELEQAYRQYQDQGVVFLGVNYVDTESEAMVYMDRFDITYPSGPDLGTRISQKFRIRGVPETYIINPSGRIDSVKKGPYSSLEEIQAAIEAAKSG
jgi:cytochrome c biogenesis protein CcmG/thiol:disulfide interchange protein DsbE